MLQSRLSWSLAALVFLAIRSEAGVELVTDINVTNSVGGSTIWLPVAELPTGTLFALDDGHGAELWRTDGTAAGTYLLRDINPGEPSSSPTGFIVINDVAYFRADDGTNGKELWRTDGTTSGTTIVADIDSRAAEQKVV